MSTWIKGRINWYDAQSGRGSIVSDDNVWYRIHEFTALLAPTDPQTRVEFELAIDSIHPIVKQVREAV
jgi:hypothetical protein